MQILVDADACPVKQEIYTVATRHRLGVTLVANSWMRTPLDSRISLQVVGEGLDVADDWIAEHSTPGDLVITSDIPLAARCLDVGAAGVHGSLGDYGWGGAYHSTYWVDPAEQLVVVYFTQLIPAGGSDIHKRFKKLVYEVE